MNTFYNANISISLPEPLDEPMEIITHHVTSFELVAKVNELIERQNALVELVKRLAMSKL